MPPGPVQPVASLETGASWTVSDCGVVAAVSAEVPLDAFPVPNNGLSRAAKNNVLFLRRAVLKLRSQVELLDSAKVF